MSMQRSYSGFAPVWPSRRPGMLLNCRWISATIRWAFLVHAQHQHGREYRGDAAPMSTPKNTEGAP